MKRPWRGTVRTRFLGLSALIGQDVYNLESEELGELRDIVVDMRNGCLALALVRCPAGSSSDDRLVAVPWGRLKLDRRLHCFVLDLSPGSLAVAPRWDPLVPDDMAERTWRAILAD